MCYHHNYTRVSGWESSRAWLVSRWTSSVAGPAIKHSDCTSGRYTLNFLQTSMFVLVLLQLKVAQWSDITAATRGVRLQGSQKSKSRTRAVITTSGPLTYRGSSLSWLQVSRSVAEISTVAIEGLTTNNWALSLEQMAGEIT